MLKMIFPPAALKQIMLVGTVLLSLRAPAQHSFQEELTDHFDAYRQKHLQEKIFVHTDKEIYVPGEILWFRVYNVEGYLHTRLDLEKCVYVELLDRNNRAVLQAKIGMEKGLGEGSFILPASIVSGDYTFRAYTNWMKNFAPDYFFHKRIRLINPQKNRKKIHGTLSKPSYRFLSRRWQPPERYHDQNRL
jgi:hypothetical protein